jgi:hypothetical protein
MMPHVPPWSSQKTSGSLAAESAMKERKGFRERKTYKP